MSSEIFVTETIRRTKFSSSIEKFFTFVRRIISPSKNKNVFSWSAIEPKWETSLHKFWLSCWAQLYRAKLFFGRKFRHFSKNPSLSPDKVSPDKVRCDLGDIFICFKWWFVSSIQQVWISLMLHWKPQNIVPKTWS